MVRLAKYESTISKPLINLSSIDNGGGKVVAPKPSVESQYEAAINEIGLYRASFPQQQFPERETVSVSISTGPSLANV